MPGILSFLGHLCCSDFEKFTFFSISREDNRKFLKKNFCFSKKFHRQGLWGGEGHFWNFLNKDENFFRNLLNKDEENIFQKSTQEGWRQKFTKNLLNKKDEFFLKFSFLLDKNFQKSKNPIDKDEEKIDFQNQVKAHTQKSFFWQKNAKIFNEKKSKF